jgi:hypothetical protein
MGPRPAFDLADSYWVTWDHDFLNLYCGFCDDGETPVDSFAGNPTGLAEIWAAMRKHQAEQHPEEN